MMCKEIHKELLTMAGMRRVREAVLRKYPFVFHLTPPDRVNAIATEGLLPSYPAGPNDSHMDWVRQAIGVSQPGIVCVKPNRSLISFGDGRARVLLAIESTFLPDRIGVDWSFGGYWHYVDQKRLQHPEWPIESVFLDAFEYFGSMALYDPISATAIRVRTKTSSENPESWPNVMSVQAEDLCLHY